MRCKFCNKVLVGSTPDVEYQKGNFLLYEVFDCIGCKVEYAISCSTQEIIDYTLTADEYRITIDRGLGNSRIDKWTQSEISSILDYWKTVLRLDCVPQNITPQNVADKIKMYMVFS